MILNKLGFFVLSILLLSINSNAQSSTASSFVQNDIAFSRSFDKGEIIDLTENEVYGSRSYSSTESVESIFYHQTYVYDHLLGTEKILMEGNVENFKISAEFVPLNGEEDLLVSKIQLTYDWLVVNNQTDNVVVYDVEEVYYLNNETSRILKVETCNGGNVELLSWGEEIQRLEKNHTAPLDQEFFKIKRISKDHEHMTNVANPEELLTYALLTPKGFYRENLQAVKDSVVFTGGQESYDLTTYNKWITYKAGNEGFTLGHNFAQNNLDFYVSSMDILPFPNNKHEKIVEPGTVIVWEQCDLMDEWTNLILKLFYIGDYGLTRNEIEEIYDRTRIIERFLRIIIRDTEK